ncbi:hypothetical protein EPO44_10245 [bacterium]|nr:MAG: hypothetical protein EPO44_10245 [bacterium]
MGFSDRLRSLFVALLIAMGALILGALAGLPAVYVWLGYGLVGLCWIAAGMWILSRVLDDAGRARRETVGGE